MGIRFYCPECGRRLNIKAFLAGKRGICPHCDSRVLIPLESQIPADAPKIRPTANRRSSVSVATVDSTVEESIGRALSEDSTSLDIPSTATSVSDPIAESPDAVWYVRPASGGQFGPARGDVMRRWLAEGRVSADSLVWREGWVDWKTAGPVFPSLEVATVTHPSAAPAKAPSFLVPDDEEQDISQPVAAPARRVGPRQKSMAPLIILGLLIVVLLVVTVVILRGT